jgi:Kef-type K+ transport system membrane component KefB
MGENIMGNLLFIIAAMVFVPWLLLKITRLEKWIPLPMAQIAFGICLGPSALGSSWPELWTTVFTQPIRTGLDSVQILAITIFAFIAGIELKPKEVLAEQGNAIWGKAFHVILVPIVLAGASFMLFFDDPVWHDPNVPFWKYAWTMGVATCITAMPMLVVASQNLGIYNTPNFRKLLALVTFDDLILWLTVAVVVSMGKLAVNASIFFAVLFALYYIWPKILDRVGEQSYPTLTVALALSMAAFSHWAGLHYVLGAFFAGMITPRHAIKWNEGMATQQMFWLMPVFFIWTGLKTSWTLDLSTILLGAVGMFIIAVATKFVGVWLAYKDQGIRIVCLKTALLQTKGLMEIFLVTMLLTAGIISVNMFAAVVIMSLISTVVAVPLAKLFYKPEIDNV